MHATRHMYDVIALDLRGHGDSDLGEEEDFSASAMVEDVHYTLIEEKVDFPIALIGTSMGGKISMAYSAAHPDCVATLVIVDMDTRLREYEEMDSEDIEARKSCPSVFDSCDDAFDVLSRWFENVEEMASDGSDRLFVNTDGQWMTKIHPFTQYLFRRRVFGEVGVGLNTFRKLSQENFDVHLLVASRDAACETTSIEEMQEAVPRMKLHFIYNSDHSIHSSNPDGFLSKIQEIMYPL